MYSSIIACAGYYSATMCTDVYSKYILYIVLLDLLTLTHVAQELYGFTSELSLQLCQWNERWASGPSWEMILLQTDTIQVFWTFLMLTETVWKPRPFSHDLAGCSHFLAGNRELLLFWELTVNCCCIQISQCVFGSAFIGCQWSVFSRRALEHFSWPAGHNTWS